MQIVHILRGPPKEFEKSLLQLPFITGFNENISKGIYPYPNKHRTPNPLFPSPPPTFRQEADKFWTIFEAQCFDLGL